jgi:hypothetical protein
MTERSTAAPWELTKEDICVRLGTATPTIAAKKPPREPATTTAKFTTSVMRALLYGLECAWIRSYARTGDGMEGQSHEQHR